MHNNSQTFGGSRAMLGVLACVLVLGMLTAFHSVVQGAVKDGALRRQAAITQADAIWRCKLLPDLPARSSCLQQTDLLALATL